MHFKYFGYNSWVPIFPSVFRFEIFEVSVFNISWLFLFTFVKIVILYSHFFFNTRPSNLRCLVLHRAKQFSFSDYFLVLFFLTQHFIKSCLRRKKISIEGLFTIYGDFIKAKSQFMKRSSFRRFNYCLFYLIITFNYFKISAGLL